jgi:MFS family permease
MSRESIPVTSIKNQVFTGIVIGFSVFFILAVFQPFGTFESRMNNKILFLAGYGIISASIYAVYYSVLMTIFKKWFVPMKWNFIRESVTIIPMLVLISMAALFYHHEIIGGYVIDFVDISYFFRISLAVAAIPFSVLLYRKWLKRNLTTISPSVTTSGYTVTFVSNNKNEKPVTVSSGDLYYIKSDGNYIEIARKTDNGIKTNLIRNSLNQVESRLPEKDFLKIHRSYFVNTTIIESINISGSSYTISLKGVDQRLPVSRSMVRPVREIINRR